MKYMHWSEADLNLCLQDTYDEILAVIEDEAQERERQKFLNS